MAIENKFQKVKKIVISTYTLPMPKFLFWRMGARGGGEQVSGDFAFV